VVAQVTARVDEDVDHAGGRRRRADASVDDVALSDRIEVDP